MARLQGIRHRHTKSIAGCHHIARITQDGRGDFLFLGNGFVVLIQLWGDEDEIFAEGTETIAGFTESLQLQIAVGSPAAPVEGQDDRPLVQKIAKRNGCALCVAQLKIRCEVSDLDRFCH